MGQNIDVGKVLQHSRKRRDMRAHAGRTARGGHGEAPREAGRDRFIHGPDDVDGADQEARALPRWSGLRAGHYGCPFLPTALIREQLLRARGAARKVRYLSRPPFSSG